MVVALDTTGTDTIPGRGLSHGSKQNVAENRFRISFNFTSRTRCVDNSLLVGACAFCLKCQSIQHLVSNQSLKKMTLPLIERSFARMHMGAYKQMLQLLLSEHYFTIFGCYANNYFYTWNSEKRCHIILLCKERINRLFYSLLCFKPLRKDAVL